MVAPEGNARLLTSGRTGGVGVQLCSYSCSGQSFIPGPGLGTLQGLSVYSSPPHSEISLAPAKPREVRSHRVTQRVTQSFLTLEPRITEFQTLGGLLLSAHPQTWKQGLSSKQCLYLLSASTRTRPGRVLKVEFSL